MVYMEDLIAQLIDFSLKSYEPKTADYPSVKASAWLSMVVTKSVSPPRFFIQPTTLITIILKCVIPTPPAPPEICAPYENWIRHSKCRPK